MHIMADMLNSTAICVHKLAWNTLEWRCQHTFALSFHASWWASGAKTTEHSPIKKARTLRVSSMMGACSAKTRKRFGWSPCRVSKSRFTTTRRYCLSVSLSPLSYLSCDSKAVEVSKSSSKSLGRSAGSISICCEPITMATKANSMHA